MGPRIVTASIIMAIVRIIFAITKPTTTIRKESFNIYEHLLFGLTVSILLSLRQFSFKMVRHKLYHITLST